jgi:hypothetical protein
MKKVVLFIYRMMPMMLSLVDELPNFGLSKSIAVLGLCGALREAYNSGILQVWDPSIDIPSVLFHVEFEDWLSVSNVKNRATCYKIFKFHLKSFEKSSRRPSPLFHTPPVSNTRVRNIWSKFDGAYQFSKLDRTYSKE